MQNADCDQPNVLVHCKVSSVLLSAVFGIFLPQKCVFVTSDNGSIWLLVQILAGPAVEPLTGLDCMAIFIRIFGRTTRGSRTVVYTKIHRYSWRPTSSRAISSLVSTLKYISVQRLSVFSGSFFIHLRIVMQMGCPKMGRVFNTGIG